MKREDFAKELFGAEAKMWKKPENFMRFTQKKPKNGNNFMKIDFTFLKNYDILNVYSKNKG